MRAWVVRYVVGLYAAGVALAAPVVASAAVKQTRNVVLIVADGLRPEEVFTGAEEALIGKKNKDNWATEAELREKYWNSDPRRRRELLLPFIWGAVAKSGQIFGNAAAGSRATVSNGYAFSYPGYNEMASGIPDRHIDKNDFGPNPNSTVFEWLNSQADYAGRVAIFGTWQTFHDIFNEPRSHLPVRAGKTLVDATDTTARGQLLRQLYQTTTRLEGDDPFDSFLNVTVQDFLDVQRPRVLFVGYGDTDNWAHAGRYDALLETAHGFDSYVEALWNRMQALPEYKDQTTFIITTDHGRGHGRVDWKEHGVKQHGSENIWIAIIGPDTAPLGERHGVAPVTQAQIAATVAALLGENYRAVKPAAAPSLLESLAAR